MDSTHQVQSSRRRHRCQQLNESSAARSRSPTTTNAPGDTTELMNSVRFYVPLYTHTHPLNGPLSGTTQVSRYQKGKTNLDFTEARDSEWQWHQLGHMQVCISLQTDNHAITPPLSFLQAGCPSCCPTNSVRTLNSVRFNVPLDTK